MKEYFHSETLQVSRKIQISFLDFFSLIKLSSQMKRLWRHRNLFDFLFHKLLKQTFRNWVIKGSFSLKLKIANNFLLSTGAPEAVSET